jgi:hypothetical protein
MIATMNSRLSSTVVVYSNIPRDDKLHNIAKCSAVVSTSIIQMWYYHGTNGKVTVTIHTAAPVGWLIPWQPG